MKRDVINNGTEKCNELLCTIYIHVHVHIHIACSNVFVHVVISIVTV